MTRSNVCVIYLLLPVFLSFGCLNGQCPHRKFLKHYVDTTSSSVLSEVFSRSQLECSTVCGKNINCMGFMRLSNGNCVMFDDVKRNTPGQTLVMIEGEKIF